MMRRSLAGLLLLGIITVGSLSSPRPTWAETLVQQNVDTRVVLAFRVGQAALQGWLPAPWQVDPVATGPSKDANLTVVFIDQLLNHDGEGKPVAGGTTRIVALAVPAGGGPTKTVSDVATPSMTNVSCAVPAWPVVRAMFAS